MNTLDPGTIQLLKQMARARFSVPYMVREILPRSAAGVGPVEVLNSFRQAFGLTFAQAKPITDWLAYGDSDRADADLHSLVWPGIEANRDLWMREERE
jgi:hypothetical protein